MSLPYYINRIGSHIWCPHKQFIRRMMPYGTYICAGGREVLFDREYAPICERGSDRIVKMCEPLQLIPFEKQEWLYNDGTPERRKIKLAENKLNEWGILDKVRADINKYISNSYTHHDKFIC